MKDLIILPLGNISVGTVQSYIINQGPLPTPWQPDVYRGVIAESGCCVWPVTAVPRALVGRPEGLTCLGVGGSLANTLTLCRGRSARLWGHS